MTTSRVILITGASSGFGLYTAALLAAKGHIVYATMRDTSKSSDLLTEARTLGGDTDLHILPLDVTRPDTVRVAVATILNEQKRIDVLINNAGFGIGGFFEDLSDAEFRSQFDVNFFGVLDLTRAVLPSMRSMRKGLIINISSMCAFSGTPAFSAYVASKWALEGFTESLMMELLPFNVRAVLVEPGAYKTKIFFENAKHAHDFNNTASPYYDRNQFLRAFIDKHMNANSRDPREVARVIGRIVEQKDPSFRNIIGWPSKIRAVLVKFIPFKLYARLVNMVFSPKAVR
jgi:NAD(P)-dependent dehydrogenase (short-subunit alcohol dehydrogenase family)